MECLSAALSGGVWVGRKAALLVLFGDLLMACVRGNDTVGGKGIEMVALMVLLLVELMGMLSVACSVVMMVIEKDNVDIGEDDSSAERKERKMEQC